MDRGGAFFVWHFRRPLLILVSAEMIRLVSIGLVVAGCSGCGERVTQPAPPAQPAVTFKPREMADALHAVVAADEEAQIRLVLQQFPMADQGGEALMALHAQRLRQASDSIQQQGAEFHYVLRSLWPINPKNAPETGTEKTGLEYVHAHPGTNYYAEESLGGRRYFTAVYPEAARVESCAACHNRSRSSPRTDFKPGEVMGGLIVRVPLEF